MSERLLTYCNLGLIDYKEAWDLQKFLFDKRVKNEISDVLLLLEHNHTYTLGKVAERSNLISNQEFLKKNNISVYDIDRGGDITYHGPGRSEEHTSELQSRPHLVCRLLLEKKNKIKKTIYVY